MTVLIFKGDILEEYIVSLNSNGSAEVNTYILCSLAAAEVVIQYDGLVALLTNDVHEWLLCRNVDVLTIFAVLHEYEPCLATSFWCCVNSGLQRGVVACAVLCNDGVEHALLRLLALHGGEGDVDSLNLLAAAAYEYALRHLEGILRSIVKTCILEYSALSSYNRCDFLTVKDSFCSASLDLGIEVQYDRAISRSTGGAVSRCA